MSFFKIPYAKHLIENKFKTTVQNLTETIWEYDKRFKDLLSQLEYNINEQLLIQWFLHESYRKLNAYPTGQV